MLAVILGAQRISHKIPGALIAVVGAIGLSWALELGQHLEVLGAVPGGLPQIALPQVAWSWALIPEEADYLFGINSLTHDHLGYVVLSQNPFQNRASRDGQEIVYEDPRLYAKYALRDFLQDRYRAAGDERAALRALNAAWGTKYTTWDTSSGDLLKGDNAWGTGTGFMDENGRGA